MSRLALILLLLTPTMAVANPSDPKAPAPAPNVLDQHQPRPISIVDTTRDGDRAGDRSCEPNSRGQIECRATAEPPRAPVSPIASR